MRKINLKRRSLPTTPEEIADDIAIKDRRFKVAQGLFMVASIVGVGVLLLATYTLQQQNHTLLGQQNRVIAQQKVVAADTKKHTDEQLQKLNDHIDCLVALFGTPNRTGLYIGDIRNCQLNSTSTTNAAPAVNSRATPRATTPQSTTPSTPSSSAPPSSGSTATTQPIPEPRLPAVRLCSLGHALTLGIVDC